MSQTSDANEDLGDKAEDSSVALSLHDERFIDVFLEEAGV